MTREELIVKINGLNNSAMMINFKEYLDESDYSELDSIENEIDYYEKQLEKFNTDEDVCVMTDDHWFLSYDSLLCHSGAPVWFKDMDEAHEYLDKARIYNKNKTKFITRKEYNEKYKNK